MALAMALAPATATAMAMAAMALAAMAMALAICCALGQLEKLGAAGGRECAKRVSCCSESCCS